MIQFELRTPMHHDVGRLALLQSSRNEFIESECAAELRTAIGPQVVAIAPASFEDLIAGGEIFLAVTLVGLGSESDSALVEGRELVEVHEDLVCVHDSAE